QKRKHKTDQGIPWLHFHRCLLLTKLYPLCLLTAYALALAGQAASTTPGVCPKIQRYVPDFAH
ncbi:MAG: hypothetical protein KDD75_05970, partial [Caldilineaceae bacterium]|nr:hypothetical protein [Caldilineaceae bacterium]